MPRRRLAIDLAGAFVAKLIALTLIYYLFFAAPPRIDPVGHFVPAVPVSASPR